MCKRGRKEWDNAQLTVCRDLFVFVVDESFVLVVQKRVRLRRCEPPRFNQTDRFRSNSPLYSMLYSTLGPLAGGETSPTPDRRLRLTSLCC
jgi:hypothetical protein